MKIFNRKRIAGTALAAVLAALGCSDDELNNNNNITIEPEPPVVSASERLELYESLFEHHGTLTKEHEPHLLQDVVLNSHNKDAPDTQVVGAQALDFGTLTPRFAKDNYGTLGVFLHAAHPDTSHSGILYTWKLGLDAGLQSRVNSDGKLVDLIKQDINICGKNYRVIDAETQWMGGDIDSVSFELMTSKAAMPLEWAGAQTTVRVDGVEYAVEFIGTQANTDGSFSAQLMINGEMTSYMSIGDMMRLANGQFVGIYSTGNNKVEFGLGAQKLEIKDGNINDDAYSDSVGGNGVFGSHSNGRDARVKIRGQVVSADQILVLNQIAYRLLANTVSQTDVYVAEGHSLDEYLDEPGASVLNVDFNGLKTQKDDGQGNLVNRVYSSLAFNFAATATGSSYTLSFTNKEGLAYSNVDFIENAGTSAADRVLEQKLVMTEGTSSTDYSIATGTQFVLSGANDFTHVLQYDSIDIVNRKLSFTDLATGAREATYDANTGEASIVVGGISYKVFVDAVTGNLAVDQDGDGKIDGSSVAIVDKYGAKFAVADAQSHYVTTNLATSADRIDGKSVDEVVDLEFNMAGSGMDITLPSVPRMYQDIPAQAWKGQSRYGVLCTWNEPTGRVDIKYPEVQEEPWTLLKEKD